MTYVFGDTEPLQAIRDRHGNQITLTRTGDDGNPQNGEISTITSPNGKWIKLGYDAERRVTRAEDSIGRVVAYTYDSGGRLETVTDPAGKVTTYGWNFSSQLETVTDPRGITYLTNEYDSAQRVRRQTLAGDGVGVRFSAWPTLSSAGCIEDAVGPERGEGSPTAARRDGPQRLRSSYVARLQRPSRCASIDSVPTYWGRSRAEGP